ncbi:MAG: hypothetical protein ACRD5L_03845, partial [Bryobacteraceae bacterium]
MMKSLLLLSLVSFSLRGQATPGIPAPWNVSQAVATLSAQAGRLKPILDQLTPQEWVAKGAPEVYVQQWRSAREELGYVGQTAAALEKQPEKLTAALDTYFRLQYIETRLPSLADGAREYQSPALGNLLLSVLGDNSANLDQLRQYITQLAVQKEQE